MGLLHLTAHHITAQNIIACVHELTVTCAVHTAYIRICHVCVHTHTHTHTTHNTQHTHTHRGHTWTRVCTHAHTCTHTHVCAHAHTHTHVYAHMHTHRHTTHMLLSPCRGVWCAIDWKTSRRPRPKLRDMYDGPLQVCAYIGAINQDQRYPVKVSGYTTHMHTGCLLDQCHLPPLLCIRVQSILHERPLVYSWYSTYIFTLNKRVVSLQCSSGVNVLPPSYHSLHNVNLAVVYVHFTPHTVWQV